MKNLRNPKFLLFLFLGIYFLLLIFNINRIPTFSGDEKIYRTSVESMMDGRVDANNHPLLAKSIWLVIVDVFYIVTGTDMPFFWRFGTVIFSLLTLTVFYKISRVFFSPVISLIATALLAFDPMYFVFSRSLQLDVIMLFWALLGLYSFLTYLKDGKYKYIFWGAFFMGLSLSSKLSALLIVVFLPIFLTGFAKSKITASVKITIKYFLLVIFGYMLGNMHFLLLGKNIISFIQYNWALIYEQFGNLSGTANFQASSPFTWFFIPQILSMYRIDLTDRVNTIIAFQNPATFLISAFTVIMTTIGLANKEFKDRKFIILIMVYLLGFYIPWVAGIRTAYYYYFLPLIPLIIILFIKLVLSLPTSKLILFIFLCLNLVCFGIYFPLLTGINVPKPYDLTFYKYSQYDYPVINRLFCQNCYPRK